LSFSPASSAFEPTTAGTTSAATTVTVTNDGEAVLTVTSVTTPAGFACLEAPPFTLAAGGGTYDLDLQFAPQRGTSGEITGSVALGTAECSFSIPVSGEALRPPSPQVASASGCGCGSGGSPAQVVPWIVALLAFGGLRRRPR
jgi:MYXO-CTERM domain-containing protein